MEAQQVYGKVQARHAPEICRRVDAAVAESMQKFPDGMLNGLSEQVR